MKTTCKKFPTIDLLEINCKKVKLDDEFKVYYETGPCYMSIKKIASFIVKRHHLKRKIYLQIMSI